MVALTVAVTPGGGFNQTVDPSCTGAPAQSTCMVSSSVTLDGVNPSIATVSVVTTASAMGLTQPVNAPPLSGSFSLWLEVSGILGLCVLATLRGRGRARNPQLVYGVTLLSCFRLGPQCRRAAEAATVMAAAVPRRERIL